MAAKYVCYLNITGNKMNFKTSMKTVLKDKYFDFKTRASRSEYWWFIVGCSLLGFVAGFLDALLFGVENLIGITAIIIQLAIIIPSIAVTARRLQDRGRSGWNQLWYITIIGIIPVFYWTLMPAKEKKNKWGINPRIAELKEEQLNLPK